MTTFAELLKDARPDRRPDGWYWWDKDGVAGGVPSAVFAYFRIPEAIAYAPAAVTYRGVRFASEGEAVAALGQAVRDAQAAADANLQRMAFGADYR